MEVVASGVSPRDSPEEEEEVKVEEEVLPDGTIHQKVVHVWHTGSRSTDVGTFNDACSTRSEILETFEQPPHALENSEDIEEVMPDGRKRKRSIKMNCLVHAISARHESMDNNQVTSVESYDLEEVVPGTVTAFEKGLDSDYEEELERKKGGEGNKHKSSPKK